MTYDEHETYRFGEFTLDVDRGALFRDGTEIRLRPKSYEVLRYLVEHAGHLVSRDQLLDAVWADTVVTNDTVTQCLIDIRKALGDQSQEIIRTVTRRGYVFELAVEPGNPAAEAAGESNPKQRGGFVRGLLAVALAAATVAAAAFWLLPQAPTKSETEAPVASGRQAIAVLPFEDMSPEGDQAYFADGVSEEILNMLARRSELRVIARTSSFSFRDRDVGVETIARELDVSHVLEGSVRKDGDSVRISVQLVDGESGEYLWTERFDRELTASSLFAIQGDIAAAVAAMVPAGEETSASSGRLPTESLAALERYYAGRRLSESRDPVDLERAVELFREATQIDPGFALAYVSLADSIINLSGYGPLSEMEAKDLSMNAVNRALEIDDQLGEAHVALAALYERDGDLTAAEASYRQGLALNPNYAAGYQWLGEFLGFTGRAEEGLHYSRIAADLDPRSAIIASDYAEVLGMAGRKDEALRQYDVALGIDPDFYVAYQGKASVLHLNFGRVAESVALYERAYSLAPESPYMATLLAEAHLDLGNPSEAAAYLDRARLQAPDQAWPEHIRLGLHTLNNSPDEARQSALTVLADVPYARVALRVLRDQYLADGEPEQALAMYSKARPDLQDAPEAVAIDDANFRVAIDVALVFERLGKRREAAALLDGVSGFLGNRQSNAYGRSDLYRAKIEAIRGNGASAIQLLKTAAEDGWRHQWWWELQHEAVFESLHGEPEFQELLQFIREDMDRQRRSLELASG